MTDLWPGLNALTAALGGWMNDLPAMLDDRFGVLAPAVAGATTAIAVALAASIYLSSGRRTARDMVRHGVATAVVIGLLAFAAYDMRHTAFDRFGIKPAVQLNVHQPTVTV